MTTAPADTAAHHGLSGSDRATATTSPARPSTGRVCPQCSGPKSKQGRICQSCRTVEKRSQFAYLDRRYTGARVVGTAAPEHERRRALEQARTGITNAELARLVDEQRTADTHRIGAPWILSLDTTDCFGRPLYEVIAA